MGKAVEFNTIEGVAEFSERAYSIVFRPFLAFSILFSMGLALSLLLALHSLNLFPIFLLVLFVRLFRVSLALETGVVVSLLVGLSAGALARPKSSLASSQNKPQQAAQ